MSKTSKSGFIQDELEINKVYTELVRLNFNVGFVKPLVLPYITNYLHPEVTKQIAFQLKQLYTQHKDTIDVHTEKIRINHIINQTKNSSKSYISHYYSYITIVLFILSLVLTPILTYLLDSSKPASYISLWICNIIFIILLAAFIKSFFPVALDDKEMTFKHNFSLLFYTLYLDLLNQ